ncbi:DUF4157 domain-containing protein [uncultured Tateyamaria sp.]|uniref:eCIS core domain-containing protein n=1 Tax=uncultured Tateyamaria sp. TaxID=455651 RepID=UPI0026361B47|nr:DUF4157 domain-containing protein [uncultured Tateyamaria sp.]
MERSVAVEAAEGAVVQRACDCGGGGACAACAAEEQLGVQPKLTLGASGDVYEQEADRVADRVVSGAGLTAAPIAATPLVQRMEAEPEEDEALQMKAETLQRMDEEEDEAVQMKPESIQRMTEEDEEEAVQMKPDRLQRMEDEEEESVQMKPAASGPAAHTGAAAAAVATGGQPLSSADRAYFEPRLGYDFSRVRLHTDASAQRAARGINARAYTLQNHIAFAPGEYSTSTEGRRLMAHELVHTLQQANASEPRVQRLECPEQGEPVVEQTGDDVEFKPSVTAAATVSDDPDGDVNSEILENAADLTQFDFHVGDTIRLAFEDEDLEAMEDVSLASATSGIEIAEVGGDGTFLLRVLTGPEGETEQTIYKLQATGADLPEPVTVQLMVSKLPERVDIIDPEALALDAKLERVKRARRSLRGDTRNLPKSTWRKVRRQTKDELRTRKRRLKAERRAKNKEQRDALRCARRNARKAGAKRAQQSMSDEARKALRQADRAEIENLATACTLEQQKLIEAALVRAIEVANGAIARLKPSQRPSDAVTAALMEIAHHEVGEGNADETKALLQRFVDVLNLARNGMGSVSFENFRCGSKNCDDTTGAYVTADSRNAGNTVRLCRTWLRGTAGFKYAAGPRDGRAYALLHEFAHMAGPHGEVAIGREEEGEKYLHGDDWHKLTTDQTMTMADAYSAIAWKLVVTG